MGSCAARGFRPLRRCVGFGPVPLPASRGLLRGAVRRGRPLVWFVVGPSLCRFAGPCAWGGVRLLFPSAGGGVSPKGRTARHARSGTSGWVLLCTFPHPAKSPCLARTPRVGGAGLHADGSNRDRVSGTFVALGATGDRVRVLASWSATRIPILGTRRMDRSKTAAKFSFIVRANG